MRVLFLHPSPLMYSEIFLRLEPLGLERVAQATRSAGHDVRLLDLQVFDHRRYFRELASFAPEAVGFSLNYLANVPEVIDLAKASRKLLPNCFIFAGGHSGSFVAEELLEHAPGAIDAVVRGEGEATTPLLLENCRDRGLERLAGVVTAAGKGPNPPLLKTLDGHSPARDLTQRRRKYFIGELDPCASIEFTRGCPWNCTFCSAWTFYGRSYRSTSPQEAVDDLARIREPNVFIVDDVTFIHADHGMAIAAEIERRGIHKRYYLETRCDVLLKNQEVFARWKRLGLKYMFLGLEAIDEEGLKLYRKRVTPDETFHALEVARSMGITVAINIIAEPSWDERRFEVIREWALSVPEIVNVTVATPYPGTETWCTESRALTTTDYRLFDIQHAVLPTTLPLHRFYQELVRTQAVLNKKHLGFAALRYMVGTASNLAVRGQTNFLEGLWKFNKVYNADRQYADHLKETQYHLHPMTGGGAVQPAQLYIHAPRVKKQRSEAKPIPRSAAAGALPVSGSGGRS